MANKRKNSILLAVMLAFLAGGSLSACKQTVVPSDTDLTKVFQDNGKAYEEAITQIMSEPNQLFSVYLQKGVEYPGADKTAISPKTKLSCEQIMRRSFALAVRRNGGAVQFVFFEGSQNGHFRCKSIIYDRDDFKDPKWTHKSTDASEVRYLPLGELNKDAIGPKPKQIGSWRLEYRYDNSK